WPLMPDEAGYFLVARGWDPQPGNMHGTYWVDRPPTLIAVFWVAHLLGSAYVPRAVKDRGVLGRASSRQRLRAARRCRGADCVDDGRGVPGGHADVWPAGRTVVRGGQRRADVQPGAPHLGDPGLDPGVSLVMVSCWLP